MGNRRDTVQLLHICANCAIRSHQSTNERVRNARYILPVYTCMHHIRSLYICVRAHAFIYGRFRGVDRPDVRRHDKIMLVPNDTAIATREDSIYIRNFCSLTANTRSYIYHTRGEFSVSGEIPQLLFAFEKVFPFPCSSNCSNLCTYCIFIFVQIR